MRLTIRTPIIVLALLLSTGLIAQNPSFEWVKQIGGIGSDNASTFLDNQGNLYNTGVFSDTVDFDPGPGIMNLTSTGFKDGYIQKLDANGNLLWANHIAPANVNSMTSTSSISFDSNGFVYLAGFFFGTADFDPGPGTLNLSSIIYGAGFIQKLDTNGNLVWVIPLYEAFRVTADDITIDANGNIFIMGTFKGGSPTDFDPGPGTAYLYTYGYDEDVYVLKLDASGNFLWVKQMGSPGLDISGSIALDSGGNLYTTFTSSGNLFIQKLEPNGNSVWMIQIVVGSGKAITVDASDNIYITGSFSGTKDFDPGPGQTILTSNGSHDIFILKLDSNGNFIWAKQMGGISIDEGISITTDINNNVYTVGQFYNTVDFDPGPGQTIFVSNGNIDLFAQKLNSNGDFLWAKQIGSTDYDRVHHITIDANNNIYTSGSFHLTVDFDLGPGTTNLTSNGNLDGFIQKLNQCQTAYTDIQTTCGSYTWIDGVTYTSSNNTAMYTVPGGAANGCDSIVTLDLTVNNASTSTDVQTACDSYTWIDGVTYSANNNTAVHTIAAGAANGCDSIVTLDLTVNSASTSIDVQTACDSYTWIDGITYSANNNTAVYTITAGAANGCDSTVTLDLTVNQVSDITTTVNGATITSNNTGATTYQWLDCDSGMSIIQGETANSYTATVNGNYAVQLTENGCVDTSACVTIVLSGITNHSFKERILVAPNPTNGTFTIQFENKQTDLTVKLWSVSGQLKESRTFQHTNRVEMMLDYPQGVYLVEILNDSGEKAVVRLIKLE